MYTQDPTSQWMVSRNKSTVERYMDGFNKGDNTQILTCMTEDVRWEMPGAFHIIGKAQVEKEIKNPAFIGPATISLFRLIEENDVVVAEGLVRVMRKEGGFLNARFCEVFTLRDGLIAHIVTYQVELK